MNLAQVNIARSLAPLDTPLMAEFVAALDRVNAIADRSPGFVWRLQTEEGDATAIRAFEDELVIINMSVWASADQLAEFVYRSGHVEVMRRRREWFERLRLYLALWWIPEGHIPTVQEAQERLAHLEAHGPSPYAFTFKRRFTPDGAPGTPRPDASELCTATSR
ncbi:MAG TPA: DUF3291 domain-containing protein [Solirubrobacteraceae bacterium]